MNKNLEKERWRRFVPDDGEVVLFLFVVSVILLDMSKTLTKIPTLIDGALFAVSVVEYNNLIRKVGRVDWMKPLRALIFYGVVMLTTLILNPVGLVQALRGTYVICILVVTYLIVRRICCLTLRSLTMDFLIAKQFKICGHSI